MMKSPLSIGHGTAGRYAEFFNSIPAAIFRTTIEGKIIYCNQTFAHTFGFSSAGELINYPVIQLYRNKKDRGALVHAIMQRGRLADLPLALRKKDGTPIWCSMTARAVLDDDGLVVSLDGIIRDISAQVEANQASPGLDNVTAEFKNIIFIFDLQGKLIDINQMGANFLGFSRQQLLGKPVAEYFASSNRDLFLVFLSDILKIGRSEAILAIKDSDARMRHIQCHAFLVRVEGRAHHIKCQARDVTDIVNRQLNNSNDQKFQGVLEMAGGVAHSLNQPLTIINNLISEVLSKLPPQDRIYQNIVKVNDQIEKMNGIIKKIGNIKKYEAMDYVAGVRIVDIDRASLKVRIGKDR